jgi:hypothetical protein
MATVEQMIVVAKQIATMGMKMLSCLHNLDFVIEDMLDIFAAFGMVATCIVGVEDFIRIVTSGHIVGKIAAKEIDSPNAAVIDTIHIKHTAADMDIAVDRKNCMNCLIALQQALVEHLEPYKLEA